MPYDGTDMQVIMSVVHLNNTKPGLTTPSVLENPGSHFDGFLLRIHAPIHRHSQIPRRIQWILIQGYLQRFQY